MMCLEVGLHCGDFAFEVRTQSLRTVHQIRHSLMICVICDAQMLSARSAERGYPSEFGAILWLPVYMMAIEAAATRRGINSTFTNTKEASEY